METTTTTTTIMPQQGGAFAASLKRSNTKIREDRATAIVKATQLLYRRQIEDLTVQIDQLNMERDGLLDLSPSDARSLVLASDFNAQEYVTKDIDLGLKIRNLEIKLDIAQKRYAVLFGAV